MLVFLNLLFQRSQATQADTAIDSYLNMKACSMKFKESGGPGHEVHKKICGLVVDDDPIARRVHGTLLNRYGLETEAVQNGKEAVDLFLSGKTYDLVVMDMEMPVMNGIQATERLRAMGVRSMIIGVTMCSLKEEKEAFIRAGLDDCGKKPLNAQLLNDVLNQLGKKVP